MDNLSRIRKFSKILYFLFSFLLIVIPLWYISYWAFLNYLPAKLITVNISSTPLLPDKLADHLAALGAYCEFAAPFRTHLRACEHPKTFFILQAGNHLFL